MKPIQSFLSWHNLRKAAFIGGTVAGAAAFFVAAPVAAPLAAASAFLIGVATKTPERKPTLGKPEK